MPSFSPVSHVCAPQVHLGGDIAGGAWWNRRQNGNCSSSQNGHGVKVWNTDEWNLVNNGIFTISTGARFLPSTVLWNTFTTWRVSSQFFLTLCFFLQNSCHAIFRVQFVPSGGFNHLKPKRLSTPAIPKNLRQPVGSVLGKQRSENSPPTKKILSLRVVFVSHQKMKVFYENIMP